MTDYWVERDGEQLGPFDEARILSDYDRGLLRPDDRLWAEGLEGWVSVEEAFAALQAPPGPDESLGLEPLASPLEPESDSVAAAEPAYRAAPEGPLDIGPSRAEFSFRYAGFWVRYGAVMIDTVIIFVLTVALIFALAFLNGLLGGELAYDDPRLNAFSFVISWLYYAGLEGGRHSATLGKRAFHLQVLHGHNLEPFGFLVGTARYGVSIISAMLLMIGYLMQPFTRKKQALHDLATGTVVIVRTPYSRPLLGFLIIVGVVALITVMALVAIGIGIGIEQGPG
jgi:uncharacterized RDD family membrane protein YckC